MSRTETHEQDEARAAAAAESPAPARREHPVPSPGDKGETPRHIDWRPWKHALMWVLGTRAIFFSVAYAARNYLATGSQGPLQEGLFDIWNRWDATLFFRVAEHGYTGAGTDPHATAFFPLFPLTVRALSALGLSFVSAGLLISAVASLVAFAYLFKLVDEELGEDAGRRSVAYLALFPTAAFLVAPYSEALFLAGAIPAFYYARRDRWHLVALPAAVASASRSAGAFLLVGLVFEFIRQKQWTPDRVTKAITSLAVGALPIALYGVYLQRIKGDFFYYFTDQKLGWGRDFVGPISSFRLTWQAASNPANDTNWMFAWRIEIVAAAFGAAIVVWALARREWGYAAYMGTFLFVLASSTWYYSIPRMLLSFFPIVIAFAYWTRNSEVRHNLVFAASACVAMMGVIVYTSGAWFY